LPSASVLLGCFFGGLEHTHLLKESRAASNAEGASLIFIRLPGGNACESMVEVGKALGQATLLGIEPRKCCLGVRKPAIEAVTVFLGRGFVGDGVQALDEARCLASGRLEFHFFLESGCDRLEPAARGMDMTSSQVQSPLAASFMLPDSVLH
jgi:hypothetical protein